MTTPIPAGYQRKYTDGQEVAFEDLIAAHQVAAQMVADHGDTYLPLFERLEKEMQKMQEKDAIKKRALEVAQSAPDNAQQAFLFEH